MTDAAPASWHVDPTGRHDHRYWDGTAWTDHVADAGVAATEPYEGSHGPPTDPPTAADVTTETPAAVSAEAPTAEAEADAPGTATSEDDPVPTAVTTSAWSDPTTPVATTPDEPTPEPTVEAPAIEPVAAVTEAAPETPAEAPRSTNRLVLGVALVAVVAVVLAVIVLATGNSSGSTSKSKIAAALVANEHFPKKDAKCVADNVVDELGASRFDGIKDFDPSKPPANLAADLPNAVANAIVSCHVDATKIGHGPLTSGTATTASSSLGGPSDVSSFEELLANEYESAFGLPRTKAECLAKAMSQAISSGKVLQGDATSSSFYRNFLGDCHVSLDDLNPATH